MVQLLIQLVSTTLLLLYPVASSATAPIASTKETCKIVLYDKIKGYLNWLQVFLLFRWKKLPYSPLIFIDIFNVGMVHPGRNESLQQY